MARNCEHSSSPSKTMDIGRLSWAPTKFRGDLRAIPFESTTSPDLVADIAQHERDAS